MATYKVIQDIEAEDKLVGWLTPRQAIYAAIVIISGFLVFLLATKGLWWMGIFFLPHMILFAVLAGPFVHDQPSEVWLLAKIRFFLKPRKRIWNQSGVLELVTITAPKKIERHLTDGLSQREVRSRLSALANTLDSRGWAIKNINATAFNNPAFATAGASDRLVAQTVAPEPAVADDITERDDILDEQNNPTAQHLDQMIVQTAHARRQELLDNMHGPHTVGSKAKADDQQWFIGKTGANTQGAKPLVSKHAAKKTTKAKKADPAPKAASTTEPNAEAKQWAERDDLTVSTIAHQVNKPDDSDPNEVVISWRH